MNLKDYYKRHIYQMGYNDGYEKKANQVGEIYFENEADVNIVLDYMNCYELTDNDKKFIKALGLEVGEIEFEMEDFENE